MLRKVDLPVDAAVHVLLLVSGCDKAEVAEGAVAEPGLLGQLAPDGVGPVGQYRPQKGDTQDQQQDADKEQRVVQHRQGSGRARDL